MDLESVFLNGTVGAGKTTTGEALHWLLADDGISNAVIDLRNRHEPNSQELTWHLDRSVELGEILSETQIETYVVATGPRTPQQVAQAVRALIGW